MTPDPSGVLQDHGERLVLQPAMSGGDPPAWPGARWIGAVDTLALAGGAGIRLDGHAGYERARLLVKAGGAVRGFVEVETPGGVLDRRVFDDAVSRLPMVDAIPPAASLPRITAVVCTRDRPGMLRNALLAILAADYPCFDVVIVDNAAKTEETADLVRNEFDDGRVTLVKEPLPGLSHARNAGLRAAQGDWVAFTDDDVVVDPGWLQALAAAIDYVPGAGCVTGLVPAGELRSPAQAFFERRVSWSKVLSPKVYSLAAPPADLPTFPFCIGEFGTGANFAVDRRKALALGGFDTDLGAGTRCGGGEDVDMFTRVLLAGHPLVVQPAAVVWHRHRDDFASLRAQARGYGTGLGAWLTKILSNPHTARIALGRSPRAARNFLHNALLARPAGNSGPESDPFRQELTRVLLTELFSVAAGPGKYLLQRRAGTG